MDPHDDDFGPYQEGEDGIAGTYDTPDEFAAAMRAWVKGTARQAFQPAKRADQIRFTPAKRGAQPSFLIK